MNAPRCAFHVPERIAGNISESIAFHWERQRLFARDLSRSIPQGPDVEIAAGWDACMASIKRPAAQEKIKALFEKGFHKPGDAEDRLGFYVGQLGR